MPNWDLYTDPRTPREAILALAARSGPHTAPPMVRESVLRHASLITTDTASAIAVVVNSGPLLAWLEDAPTPPDMLHRYAALQQQWVNLLEATDEARAPVMDNPDAFVAGAKILYAFTTAGAA